MDDALREPDDSSGADDLTPEEERRLREQIRQRLVAKEEAAMAVAQARAAERQRRLERERLRWRIIEEETERFHRQRGRVRYVSSSGQILWLTPEEIRARRGKRVRGRRVHRARRLRSAAVVAGLLRVSAVSFLLALGVVVALAGVIFVVEFV